MLARITIVAVLAVSCTPNKAAPPNLALLPCQNNTECPNSDCVNNRCATVGELTPPTITGFALVDSDLHITGTGFTPTTQVRGMSTLLNATWDFTVSSASASTLVAALNDAVKTSITTTGSAKFVVEVQNSNGRATRELELITGPAGPPGPQGAPGVSSTTELDQRYVLKGAPAVSGPITIDHPPKRSIAIQPHDFAPFNGIAWANGDYFLDTELGPVTPTSKDNAMIAPVHLPDGAVPTAFGCRGAYFGGGSTGNSKFRFYFLAIYNGVQQCDATDIGAGTSGAVQSTTKELAGSICNGFGPVITSSSGGMNFALKALVLTDNVNPKLNASPGLFKLYNCHVEYTTPSVFP